MLRLVLLFLFGDPRLALCLRVLAAVTRLCPCAAGDALCERLHRESASAIALVAYDAPDTERAAALLVGAGTHETCFRVERQAAHGPAVTVWQLEVPRGERAALLADPVRAARLALRTARSGWRSYACGSPGCGGAGGARAEQGLAASYAQAWWALSQ
jgi:hypothetical protein